MIIGEVNAAVNPFIDGFAFTARAWFTTCCLRLASHWSGVCAVGGWKAGPRSSSGWSIDGSVLKNSTPAVKSFITSPICGTSMIPVGSSAVR